MYKPGAIGMESLAPEFFNVTLEKAFYTPHTTALSATRPRTLESAPSASVSPRTHHGTHGAAPFMRAPVSCHVTSTTVLHENR